MQLTKSVPHGTRSRKLGKVYAYEESERIKQDRARMTALEFKIAHPNYSQSMDLLGDYNDDGMVKVADYGADVNVTHHYQPPGPRIENKPDSIIVYDTTPIGAVVGPLGVNAGSIVTRVAIPKK